MANAKQPEQEEEKKKSGFLKYIILVVLLIALAGGGYFAYVKFFAKPPAVAEAPADAKTDEAAPKAEEKPAPAKEEKKAEAGHGGAEGAKGEKGKAPSNEVSLPPFVVNLADPNARRYLKLVIDVEMTGQPELLEANKAKVRDALLLLLSSKTSQDLATLEGKILLRKEIVDRLNQALGQAKVARVYFTDFVIQ